MTLHIRLGRSLLPLLAMLVAALTPDVHTAAAPPIVVETWNIRYDNPGDGPHAWRHRREGVIEHLRDTDADVIGLQEVLPRQLTAIRAGLDGHDACSRGREREADRGEAVPIFWRRDRWRLDREHATHFWLSETPDVPGSMSWKTACTRMVTMIRLVPVEPSDGRSPVWVCNLHLDHQSAEARVNGAALVRDRIASRPEGMRDEPVVILGDFNATPGSPPVETLLAAGDDGAFVDAWAAVDAREGVEDGDPARDRPSGTWNGWDANARGGRIDFVLVRGMDVVTAEILHPMHDAGPLSDHWPVRATLAMPTTATDASSVSAE